MVIKNYSHLLNNKLSYIIKKIESYNSSSQYKALVYGGYLRNAIIDIPCDDIDIVTNMPINIIKKLFPSVIYTDKGFKFGVVRLIRGNTVFEISSHKDLDHFIESRDFVINSLILQSDGTLIDKFGALNDINHKIIRPLQNPSIHFKEFFQAYLRCLRMSSSLGFKIDDNLIVFLKKHKSIFFRNTEERIQEEGIKILNADYPLNAIYYLNLLGFINTKNIIIPFNFKMPNLTSDVFIRFSYISYLIGINSMREFIELFGISSSTMQKIDLMFPYFNDDFALSHISKSNPRLLNRVIFIKKYQYNNDKESLKKFFKYLKKKT